jgi:hypothetical protein
MNCRVHYSELKDLFTSGGRKCRGVYIISQHQKDSYMKVGLSWANIWNRIWKGYSLAWSYKGEFWLNYAIITADIKDAKIMERALLSMPYLKNIEENDSQTGRTSKEWKVSASRVTFRKALQATLRNNINHWVMILSFSENSWKICYHNKDIKTGCFTLNTKSTVTKPPLPL